MSKAVLDKIKNSSNAANKLSLQDKQDQEPKRGSNQRQENNSSNNDSQNPIPASNPILASMSNIYLKFNEYKFYIKEFNIYNKI